MAYGMATVLIKVIETTCNKYGIVKQAASGYTPQHNALVEEWFRTNGEKSRCQLSQINMGRVLGGRKMTWSVVNQ
jgi:hypothetical protein